ncbi:S-adenosyl-L-methionine-dependent methyltransferase [Leptodontidium sp. MPI-SDFR-AT-0119]|nr:S-adenosyl-L-methionine-dependent methyltransferase [Leptodontidium sp. MPI-SDFR-AT-0119]
MAEYVLPMDEEEKDRLDFQTRLAWLSLADEHPETQVLGVDLAAVQPMFVPPNLQFEVDDLEKDWNFTHKFDCIHSQLVIGAFQDWPRFIKQSLQFLEPGGYLEVHDIDFVIKCDDGTLPDDSDLIRWHTLMHEGASAAGFPLDAISKVPQMMRDAGFEDVVAIPVKWPINTWPKDRHHKEIGQWAPENFSWGCQSMSLAFFTRALGWSTEEVTVFTAKVKKDLRTRKYHAYWNFWIIYGRKPGGGQSQADRS